MSKLADSPILSFASQAEALEGALCHGWIDAQFVEMLARGEKLHP